MEERALREAESLELRAADLERRAQTLEDRERNLVKQSEELKQAKRVQRRELERISGPERRPGEAAAPRGRRAGGAPSGGAQDPADRGGGAPRGRAACAEHPRGGDAAPGGQALDRDDDPAGRAPERRDEGPDHRPRRPQHPRPREALRRGRDHRRDARRPWCSRASTASGARSRGITLERLIADGRIHPGADRGDVRAGRDATSRSASWTRASRRRWRRTSTPSIPELARLIGQLRFRTSYGQNVLDHLIECANLAGILAEELGASAETARRAAFLHDIGKAVTHEVEGPHALIGARIARRHGEAEAVAHAMEAHHNEVEPKTVEAVIVQAADAVSGRPPGRARRLARAVRGADARPRGDRLAPPRRRARLRDARGPRDPRRRRPGHRRRRRARR